jgi:hypothetical protein
MVNFEQLKIFKIDENYAFELTYYYIILEDFLTGNHRSLNILKIKKKKSINFFVF